jgi:hypothetical protein
LCCYQQYKRTDSVSLINNSSQSKKINAMCSRNAPI